MTVTEPTHHTVSGLDAPAQPGDADTEAAELHDELVDDEVLVEEISIDGMCGVY